MGMYGMSLRGFTLEEGDSISVLTYPANGLFSIPIDSFFTAVQSDGSDSLRSFYFTGGINPERDYRVLIHSTGHTFDVGSFTFNRNTCNNCFPYHPKDDYYNVLSGYSVNSQAYSGQEVVLSK